MNMLTYQDWLELNNVSKDTKGFQTWCSDLPVPISHHHPKIDTIDLTVTGLPLEGHRFFVSEENSIDRIDDYFGAFSAYNKFINSEMYQQDPYFYRACVINFTQECRRVLKPEGTLSVYPFPEDFVDNYAFPAWSMVCGFTIGVTNISSLDDNYKNLPVGLSQVLILKKQ